MQSLNRLALAPSSMAWQVWRNPKILYAFATEGNPEADTLVLRLVKAAVAFRRLRGVTLVDKRDMHS